MDLSGVENNESNGRLAGGADCGRAGVLDAAVTGVSGFVLAVVGLKGVENKESNGRLTGVADCAGAVASEAGAAELSDFVLGAKRLLVDLKGVVPVEASSRFSEDASVGLVIRLKRDCAAGVSVLAAAVEVAGPAGVKRELVAGAVVSSFF